MALASFGAGGNCGVLRIRGVEGGEGIRGDVLLGQRLEALEFVLFCLNIV